jgi:cell division topological specificity factor MinE
MANMTKVLVVTSGKGGVGKTTSTAALGAALAQAGKKVAVVDFDVGLRNLDLVMGAERRVVFDLINVVQGVAKLSQALIRDKRIETLWLLPASQTRDKDALTEVGVGSVIKELRGKFDWVICDSRRHRHQSGSVVGARFRPHHRAARFQDRAGREGPAGREAHFDHPLRRATRGARRDAQYRGRPRHPIDPAARHHPREPGGAAGVEYRLTGDGERCNKCAGPRLSRRGAPALRRGLADDRPERSERSVRQAVRTESGMTLFNLFRRRGSAPIARERLQILLAHERSARGQSDLLGILREEILAVITKHVTVDHDNVRVRMDRGANVSTLEIDVEIPNPANLRIKVA